MINRGERDKVSEGVVFRIGTYPVQTLLGARLGLVTQPRYKVDLWVKNVKTQWLTSGEWGCSLTNGPKLAVRQPNNG